MELLRYGSSKYDVDQNSDILNNNTTITFILKSERFSGPLLYNIPVLHDMYIYR